MKVAILKLRGILLTSIPIDMNDEDAMAFQADVLRMLSDTEATGLVIDITAMNVVDSYMARVINDTAVQAGMLGAQVVLCGMQPDVALTLIEMGRELIGVETALNLDQAFNRLETMIEEREA
ncbi:MAG: STAS domain-containing protein [Nitrospiraceae bacterium]|nr:STAS domain-containing protein [Nitrospiraceae bacterium]